MLSLGVVVYGCGDSGSGIIPSTGQVNTNNNGGATGGGPATNIVQVRAVVGPQVPGAQQVAFEQAGPATALLRQFSSVAQAQALFTLPGARATAYSFDNRPVANTTVGADGIARFELPNGTYRFVITTDNPAVVLQTVATTRSNNADVNVTADATTTAATLVALNYGRGLLNPNVYGESLKLANEPEFTNLTNQLNSAMENGVTATSANGSSVVDANIEVLVANAALRLPAAAGGTTGGGGGTGGGSGSQGTGTTGSGTGTGGEASLVSITISPNNPSRGIDEVVEFTARGSFDDGSSRDLTSDVTWSSSSTSTANISSSGEAQTQAAGSTTITARLGNVSGTTTLTVND